MPGNQYTWDTNSGTWDLGTNWTPTGGPMSPDLGEFLTGSGTITLPGTASNVFVAGAGGPWTFTGGTLSLTDVTQTFASTSSFALDVAGTLYVSDATIDTWNGGTVGAPVGVGLGTGDVSYLEVDSGGTILAGTTNSNNELPFLIGNHGDGTLNINGGLVETYGGLVDGRGGAGALIVGPGGSLAVLLDETGNAFLQIGRGSNSTSTLTARGGTGLGIVNDGSVSSQDGVAIGGRGVTGTLVIENDGQVTSNVLATGTNANSGLVVGSTFVANGTTYFGTGSLEIDSGGTFDDSAVADETSGFASQIAPTGTAWVTVNDGLLNAGSDGLGIALDLNSSATLTLENAATLDTGSTNSSQLAGLAIGRGGAATLWVSGGSNITDHGGMFVGRAGAAQVNVSGSSDVRMTDPAGNLDIGVGGGNTEFYTGAPGVGGQVSLSGGSTLYSAGRIDVGGDGVIGNLLLQTGATAAAAGDIDIANGISLAAGTTVVSPSGTFTLGSGTTYAGNGGIFLYTGSTLVSGGTIYVGDRNIANLDSGLLDAFQSSVIDASSVVVGPLGGATLSLGSGSTLNATQSVVFGTGGGMNLLGGTIVSPIVNRHLFLRIRNHRKLGHRDRLVPHRQARLRRFVGDRRPDHRHGRFPAGCAGGNPVDLQRRRVRDHDELHHYHRRRRWVAAGFRGHRRGRERVRRVVHRVDGGRHGRSDQRAIARRDRNLRPDDRAPDARHLCRHLRPEFRGRTHAVAVRPGARRPRQPRHRQPADDLCLEHQLRHLGRRRALDAPGRPAGRPEPRGIPERFRHDHTARHGQQRVPRRRDRAISGTLDLHRRHALADRFHAVFHPDRLLRARRRG
ncbi:MAG TPA: hypothetical protein VJY39_16825 [Acidisphaera sp.]|nr:hypothetical protein [Acidisphaera sp.]